MRLVIADTGPINYLIQIGSIDLLPRVFEKVALPTAVQTELSHPRAPLLVQRWIAAPPPWLEIYNTAGLPQVPVWMKGKPPLSLWRNSCTLICC